LIWMTYLNLLVHGAGSRYLRLWATSSNNPSTQLCVRYPLQFRYLLRADPLGRTSRNPGIPITAVTNLVRNSGESADVGHLTDGHVVARSRWF